MKCKPTLIIHGGAGNLSRSSIPPRLYDQYHASLLSYLRSTHALLNSGSSALDAAVHAVSLLEDDELFNCARGSVFTSAGTIEMEASVMVTSLDGSEPRSDSIHKPNGIDTNTHTAQERDPHPGSIKRGVGVIGLRNVRHPIQLAREVLLRNGLHNDGDADGNEDGGTMHAQLSAPYVEDLAREWGLEFQPDEYFWTKRRWDEHLRKGRRGQAVRSSSGAGLDTLDLDLDLDSLPQGTVGCVCLDQYGNLAVATSTGGMTNKVPGRVGDTPTLGAGFWAERWDEPYLEWKTSAFWSGYWPPGRSWMDEKEEVEEEEEEEGRSMRWKDCLPSFLRRESFSMRLGGDYNKGRTRNANTDTDTEKQKYGYTTSTLTSTPASTPESGIQSLQNQNENHPITSLNPPTKTKTIAVALSGTGNGDSFLRTCAARTASAISRLSPSMSLSTAVRALAGPGGELQRSAGNRWGDGSGEGEGGMIGIEAVIVHGDSGSGDMGMREPMVRGSLVFDYNCGGMWRAWMEGDGNGGYVEKVMVFRERYY